MKLHRKLEFRTRSFIKRHPALYFPLSKILGSNNNSKHVGPNTNLCIEGFPRSANSFTTGMIAHSQRDAFKIADHTHAPAQIIRAYKLQIPTLVLIRNPVDTVVSFRGLQLEIGVVERKNSELTDLTDVLRVWIKFYKTIYPLRNYFITGLFESVTEDLTPTVERLNAKFDIKLNVPKKNLEPVKQRGYHALPSERRDSLKEQARHGFDCLGSEKEELVAKAKTIFNRFAETVERYESL